MRSMEMEGVDVVFGIPGGAILPAYDPLLDSSIRHILMRHEQGAGHAAEGYAHATGRPGVCMATSGPGGCNLVTALADAYMDSIPLVAITGQVPTAVVGNDAFQEAYITGIAMPVTKHTWMVTDPADIPRAIREAFHIASTGRPGPVLVDLPKDVLIKEADFEWPEEVDLAGYKPTTKGNVKQVREAVKLILAAERPVIYAGGGIIRADAADELRKLAETGQLPVVTTLMGRGAFPDTHELGLGMPGMHGHYTAVTALQKADLLVVDRRPLRRPRHRTPGHVRAEREGHPRRHRPGRDREEPRGRRPDRRRRQGRHRDDGPGAREGAGGARRPRPLAPGSRP